MAVGHEKGFYLYLYLLRTCGRRFSLYVVGMVGGRGEGWATVICPSINCQGGAGPWLTPSKDPRTQDTLQYTLSHSLTREERQLRALFLVICESSQTQPGQRHHISDRGALSKRGKFSEVCKKLGPLHAITAHTCSFAQNVPIIGGRPGVWLWRGQLKILPNQVEHSRGLERRTYFGERTILKTMLRIRQMSITATFTEQ